MLCLHPVILSDRVVPCGKCIPCLKRRQRDWFIRIQQELLVSTCSYFVTLTYEDEHLDFDDGVPVVSRRDCQLFFKRLRKEIYPDKVRYFLCSEYGPRTLRPHYHCIIFNFPVNLDAYKTITKCWKKGFVTVAPVNDARCNYLAKYVVTGYVLPDFLQIKSRKPFSLQSRHPGIGYSYLSDRNVARHRLLLTAGMPVQGHTESAPRYYRDRIFNDDEKRVISERIRTYCKNSLYEFVRNNFSDDPLDVRQYDEPERRLVDKYSRKLKTKGKL